jgi:hypothetical protein
MPLPVALRYLSMQHKRKERIMLLTRKGFVKVAVEQGLDGGIIPVYHYGNTQVCLCCHHFRDASMSHRRMDSGQPDAPKQGRVGQF